MSILKWNREADNRSVLHLEQPEKLYKIESSESCLGNENQRKS